MGDLLGQTTWHMAEIGGAFSIPRRDKVTAKKRGSAEREAAGGSYMMCINSHTFRFDC